MFDLVTGATEHLPRPQAVPLMISLTADMALVAGVGLVTVLVGAGAGQLPEAPSMLAFVAAPPAALPPPPPSPTRPAAAAPRGGRPVRAAEPPLTEGTAPVEAPFGVNAEPAADEEGLSEGIEGGVEGGIASSGEGVVVDEPPPPPPPRRAPAAPTPPIRVGGRVPQPELLHRVEPEYPRAAVDARVQGVVIIETVVDEDGRVVDVRLLRSAGDVLDRAAIAAIRQWRYAPLQLDGMRVRFLLTATLSFKLTD